MAIKFGMLFLFIETARLSRLEFFPLVEISSSANNEDSKFILYAL
jgi:hypothetical protein